MLDRDWLDGLIEKLTRELYDPDGSYNAGMEMLRDAILATSPVPPSKPLKWLEKDGGLESRYFTAEGTNFYIWNYRDGRVVLELETCDDSCPPLAELSDVDVAKSLAQSLQNVLSARAAPEPPMDSDLISRKVAIKALEKRRDQIPADLANYGMIPAIKILESLEGEPSRLSPLEKQMLAALDDKGER